MWLMTNKSFLSCVEHREDPKLLCVRARVEGHIEAVFPKAKVSYTPDGDYSFRTILTKTEVAAAVSREIMGIDYDNFKNSVKNVPYHDALLDTWGIFWKLQHNLASKIKARIKVPKHNVKYHPESAI